MGFILILRTLQTPSLSTPADSSKVRQDNSLDLEKGFVKVMHDILIFKIWNAINAFNRFWHSLVGNVSALVKLWQEQNCFSTFLLLYRYNYFLFWQFAHSHKRKKSISEVRVLVSWWRRNTWHPWEWEVDSALSQALQSHTEVNRSKNMMKNRLVFCPRNMNQYKNHVSKEEIVLMHLRSRALI